MDDLWQFADSLVSGYWTHDPGYQDPNRASFWNPPPQIDYFGGEFMRQAEFISSSMESPFEATGEGDEDDAPVMPGGAQALADALEQARQLTPPVQGYLEANFGGPAVTLPIPYGAPAFTDVQGQELARDIATTAQREWAVMTLTDPEGALTDEFAWMPLKPSTVKRKRQMGLSPAEAARPNYRTGDMARAMLNQVFGGPTIETTPTGATVRFGPNLGAMSSKDRLTWSESQLGAGPGTPNPAAGRGRRTSRPARPYTFTPAMRNEMDRLIRDWIDRVNADRQAHFGNIPALDPNQLLWS